MGLPLMLLVATAALLGYCQTDEKVSFYGASYIHFPVQEAKGGTDISFRFRTHLPDAMLLLAGGKTDYCLIKLEAGRLQVRINLGAGESEMASARGLTLNDLTWHEVNLTRREANMTLQIDVIHTTRSILPGRFFELNIHYGVYIGGQGDFDELFLGHTEYLRGCMADIMYNGANVIEYAKTRRSKSEATAVTWSCSAEFDATRETEVSFVDDGAFTSIPLQIPRSGSRWELELKTASDSGMLLYNTGHTSYADYLGIELHQGRIRVLMNKGNGPSELTHPSLVGDGAWHRVAVDFNPTALGITVDDREKRMNLPLGGNRYLDLAETLFIGGTELNKRARAINKGLKSGDKSYKGCLRGMLLGGKPLGMPDVKVSQGIIAGCVWSYACLQLDKEPSPCIREATCNHIGVGSFECACTDRAATVSCRSPDYRDEAIVKKNLPVTLDILSLGQLSVSEGGHVRLNRRNIEIVLDIAKYGMDDASVSFGLVSPPEHGTLYEGDHPVERNRSFTLRDMNQERIQYSHDDSESTKDEMILELRLTSGTGQLKLPSYLQGSLRFPLDVNITPVNDPPVLEIPTAKVLRLAQGTKKTLTKELVWSVDPDSPPEMLTYTVLRADDTDAGHVERSDEPGRPIETFTQAELLRGTIAYVHRGNANSNALLGLQVSDGTTSSQSGFLRILAYPLQIKLKHNTGLVVVHRSFSLLRAANISFATNSDDSSVEIRYDIIKPPEYGLVEKSRDGVWSNVDHFTSKDVESERIRYVHNVGSPTSDEFKFQASVRQVKTQQNFDFKITFIDLELRQVSRTTVEFTDAVQQVPVTSDNLNFQTNPLATYPSKMKYSIVATTKYGYAILGNEILLQVGDTFTQEDVDSGRLKYRLFKRGYSPIDDQLVLEVSAPQCQSIVTSISIKHRLTNAAADSGHQFVESIKVVEGSKVPLRIVGLVPKNFGVNRLIYNITEGPSHGWLTVHCRANESTRPNATYFVSDELADENVYYHHDDTETLNDSFKFVAVATDGTDFMYVGQFDVEVALQNDNPPERTIETIFHVVSNGERPITSKDLAYDDRDTGTKPDDIVYTKKVVTNGAIYAIDEPTIELGEFNQRNINDRKIMFRHRGEEDSRGRFEFEVSDGRWRVKGVLDIRASPPYIRFREGNASVVRFNASVALSPKVIDVETNLNGNDRDIKFVVIGKPKHGALMKHGRETASFSREDLIRGNAIYRHFGGSLAKDDFRVRAAIKGVSAETRVTVRVYPKSYWEPLIVVNNRTILVEETTSVSLNNKCLEISHPNISASEITYLVRDSPRHGYLEVQSNEESHISDETATNRQEDDESMSLVRHFDQSMLNEARVYYVQSSPNQTSDSFVVDVTNGVTWSRGLVVNFVIVPDKVYLEPANITVVEGKSVVLAASDFRVATPYFVGKITDYKIVAKPKHGSVHDSTKNNPIKKFSQKHLNAGVIMYKHNGDESPSDDFRITVVAAGDKTSQPIEVKINVQPVNDEIPVLVNRSVISVWQGGSVILDSSKIASLDNDTAPNEIIYNLTNVRNGYLWHADSPDRYIYNFTQAQIDQSKIVFTHTNGTEASFTFVLYDGVHATSNYEISVVTAPIKLSVKLNNPLNVFPLTRKIISNLITTCSDPKRDVIYTLRKGPNLGKIIMETSEGTWHEVDRFTQSDVNASRVTYEHTKQFMDLSTNDSFVFDVETHFADIITNQVFQIDVSVSSGGLDRYIAARTVRVEEGGSAHVVMNISGIVKYLRTKAGIENPTVLSRLTRQPSHGHVMLVPDSNITTFTQLQIEGELVAYYHDHSDSIDDRISFSLYLTPGHVMLCNATVPVVISPINDEPFKLMTNEPFITVVQNQTQTITRDDLLTTDPDTPPRELVYDLISGPTHGKLLLSSLDQNSSEVPQVTTWTQQDIDSNRLIYEHNGTTQAASFYFRVSDHSFNPVYKVFNVHVLPIRLNVTVAKPMSLPQGSNMADLSEDSIRLDTNARQEQVIYEITRSPKHGMLYVRDVPAVTFRHGDLLSKSVVFVQTDMTVSNDSFCLSARLSNFRLSELRVDINVAPLIITEPMMAIAGEKNEITRRHMDATPLAELTHSNPAYRVTRKPKYCKLKRIIRSSGEKRGSREREVSRFTHSEVVSKVIFVVCRRLPAAEPESVTDSFGYTLSATSYQPARGVFEMLVRNSVAGEANSTLSGPMDPVGHEGEMAVAPNMSQDYILILGMLSGVLVLAVVVIITIKCRQNRYKHSEESDKRTDGSSPAAVGVIPLPRPPDHLMPATPHLKRFGTDHPGVAASTPLPGQANATSTLPQCKVIPLSALDSVTGSDADVSGRYPYGVADGEEWSSFDTGDLPCQTATTRRPNPLLRRNQYWV